jgi:hypothetical protein
MGLIYLETLRRAYDKTDEERNGQTAHVLVFHAITPRPTQPSRAWSCVFLLRFLFLPISALFHSSRNIGLPLLLDDSLC